MQLVAVSRQRLFATSQAGQSGFLKSCSSAGAMAGVAAEVLVLAGNAGSRGSCPLTPREVLRAWSRLRPRGPHAGRGTGSPRRPA